MTDVDDHVRSEDPIIGAVETGLTAPSARGLRWPAVVLPPLVLTAVVIGCWYAISYLVLVPRRRFLLRPPHEVMANGFLDWEAFSDILTALWSSAKVALIGLLIAIVVGMAVAVAMSQAKLVERAVFPYMVMLQAIPILAIVPLIGFWFGYGLNSRVIVCVIISIFPIIANTLFGLQSADPSMHDLFTLHRVSRATRLRKLMFPNALPAIFTGLRISAGLSVIGAIVGDFFFRRGEPGLGILITNYQSRLQSEQMYGALIFAILLGVVTFLVFGLIGKK